MAAPRVASAPVPAATTAPAGLRRIVDSSRAPLAVTVLVVLAGVAHLLHANRGTFFYLDDWDFAIGRADLNGANLFGPQNQNWHTLNVLLFRGLAELFGLGTYLPARLVAAAVLVGIAVMVGRYAWTRLAPWTAPLVVLPLFFTAGWETVLWPFQVAQLLSIAAGLAALVLLDGERRARVPLAAALLVVATASSSAGIPLLGVVLVDRLLRSGRRLEALTVLPAIAAYLWWSDAYGYLSPNPNPSDANQVLVGLRQSVDTGMAAVQTYLGFSGTWGSIAGLVLLFGLVVAVCWRLFGAFPSDRPRIVALAAGLVGYWVLLSYGRSNVTGYFFSPRYLFISVVLLTLLLVELARSGVLQHAAGRVSMPERPRHARIWTRALPLVAVVLVLNASWQNGQTLRTGGFGLRTSADAMRGQIAALSLLPAARREAAFFFLDPVGPGIARPATYYFDGVDRFGGDTPTEAEIRELPQAARVQVDRALLGLSGGELPPGEALPPPSGPAPRITAGTGGTTAPDSEAGASCVAVTGPADTTEALLPISVRLRVTNTGAGPLTLFAGRYGPVTQESGYGVAPGSTRVVEVLDDLGTAPWTVGVRGRTARVCAI